jgi:hypothetical protein
MLSPRLGVNNIYVKNQVTASQPSTHKATELASSKRKYVGRFEKDGLFV